jgi:O-succinylbenzoate synthase
MLKDFLVPAVLGQPWTQIEELTQLYKNVKRNNFAKAGLEMACWDLLAQAQGQPLHAMLGGNRKEILSGVSLGIEQDIGRLFDNIEQFLDEGYRRIKLKIAPGKDVDVIRQVRERYPDLPLMVDANSAYTLSDLPVFKALDTYSLMMVEQPLAHDDIIDHAKLQRELQTPLCLDESIHSVADARKALELGSCRIINIKVSRLGGVLEAKRVHDFCHAQEVPVWCGGMHEYGVGRAANLAISSLPGFSLPGDVSGSDKYYAQDIVDPPIRAVRGAIAVPRQPGIGYTPNEERIHHYAIRTLSLPG